MTSLLDQANNQANREAFLDRLAKKSGRSRHQLADHPFKPLNDLPEQMLADLTPTELLDAAKQNSESVNAELVVKSSAELADYLTELAHQDQAKRLLLPGVDASEWADYQLDGWAQNPGVEHVATWSPTLDRDQNEQNADQADIAIGLADYLIAATGSVTVVNRPEMGRGFNFLPTHYVALVPQSGLVRSTRQAMVNYEHRFSEGLKTSAITIISGPSNSGDIEMELVVGVHGPVQCTYVVISDR